MALGLLSLMLFGVERADDVVQLRVAGRVVAKLL